MARTTIRPTKLNHMNVVVQDMDKSVRHFDEVFGAELMYDIPRPEMHAYLLGVGRVLFELFQPLEYLLISRYGPHYLGVEYQAQLDVVREVLAERKMSIVRDVEIAVHTDPAETFGISFEFCGHEFTGMDWDLLGGKMKPMEYWRDEHPAGFTGLKGYSACVHDIGAATAFYQSFLGAEVVYDEAREAAGARAVGLKVSDDVVELLTATGPGLIADHLAEHGQGVRSTGFAVRDLEQAKRYFAARGVPTEPGVTPGSIAIPAQANLGVMFEFWE
jgi:catechol 2,3-dioxygenase-like lactoylglutathione lyase family enzyme